MASCFRRTECLKVYVTGRFSTKVNIKLGFIKEKNYSFTFFMRPERRGFLDK
jgi:hypothetical protein